MTLDEVIKHCEEVANDRAGCCEDCAEEHRQLAEWLKDYKRLKEREPCDDCISRQAVLDITWEEPSYTDAMNVLTEVRDKVKELPSVNPKQKWIPVSERLPKDFGVYLITLEGGDVCKCEFNPDFIDEEHENGAFTYYHQYFDPATLGLIDGEDEAVDAIAWMPFEPYDPQESEDKE